MPEEKKRSGIKVCGWLSDEVFSRLNELGYKSPTSIVRRGAELIAGQSIGEHGEFTEGTEGNTEEHGDTREVRAQVREQREHLGTCRTQIELLTQQLLAKDEQISQLNEATQKQAVHIQSLIQENSRLNSRLLPEPGAKKKWWKIR
jgi:hypothetical protein